MQKLSPRLYITIIIIIIVIMEIENDRKTSSSNANFASISPLQFPRVFGANRGGWRRFFPRDDEDSRLSVEMVGRPLIANARRVCKRTECSRKCSRVFEYMRGSARSNIAFIRRPSRRHSVRCASIIISYRDATSECLLSRAFDFSFGV